MKSHRWGRLAALAAVATAVAILPAPATADWLVARDGSRVETKGAWQVKGQQVVFTLKNGQLGSLRLGEVDLDASAKATAAAIVPAATSSQAAAPAKKKSVLVLTDKDVSHLDPTTGEAKADATQPDAAAAPGTTTGAVLVDTWERGSIAGGIGLEIFGGIKNTSKDTATDITITVKILDEEGKLIASVPATVSSSVLAPGADTNFRATFPGVTDFTSARFEVKNRSLLTKPPAEKPGANSVG